MTTVEEVHGRKVSRKPRTVEFFILRSEADRESFVWRTYSTLTLFYASEAAEGEKYMCIKYMCIW